MSNITRANVSYALNQPLNLDAPYPIVAKRDPGTADKAPIGQEWVNTTANTVFFLTSVANNAANWVNISGGAGVFSSLTVNPGPTNLSTVGVGAVSIGNAANTSAVTITSGTGGVAIVGGGNTISIGNDAAANTVNIGSNTGAAATTINSGTGAITLSPANTGTIVLGTATQTGAISIGVSTGTQSINIADATGATAAIVNMAAGVGSTSTITMGTTTAASALTLNAGTTGGITLLSGGNVSMAEAAQSAASPTASVTINARVGNATFTGFTTAAAASQVFTITNSVVATNSSLLVTLGNIGTNDAEMTVQRVQKTAGSFIVTAKNNGGAALNGDVTISFWIFN